MQVYSLTGASGEVWLKYCNLVASKGVVFYDEGETIVELLNVCICFHDFNLDDPIFERYGDIEVINLYRKKMKSQEIIPELNSSYGKRLYDQLGVNQVKWAIERLRRKPETKAATISLLLPDDPGPRIPCLCIIDFKIRDNKLYLTGYFRSQNVVRSYANFISIRELHEEIANRLNVQAGDMLFFVSSAHFYNKDIDKIRLLSKAAKE